MEDQTQTQSSDETLYVLTDEQLNAIADGAARGAAAGVSSDVSNALARSHDDLSGQIQTLGGTLEGVASAAGTVQLTDDQFRQLCDLMSAQLHGSLYLFAALMFLTGLYGITQVVRHWKAGS